MRAVKAQSHRELNNELVRGSSAAHCPRRRRHGVLNSSSSGTRARAGTVTNPRSGLASLRRVESDDDAHRRRNGDARKLAGQGVDAASAARRHLQRVREHEDVRAVKAQSHRELNNELVRGSSAAHCPRRRRHGVLNSSSSGTRARAGTVTNPRSGLASLRRVESDDDAHRRRNGDARKLAGQRIHAARANAQMRATKTEPRASDAQMNRRLTNGQGRRSLNCTPPALRLRGGVTAVTRYQRCDM